MINEYGPRPGQGTRSTNDNFSTSEDTAATDSFWRSRQVLERIHDFARARRAAPWAVLGTCLARVVTTVPPFVVLPPMVGGHGSLNLFVGLIGESGSGKGAATVAAMDAVRLPHVFHANLGSGEGLSHLFAKRSKDGVERIRESVLLQVPEVDTMTALGSRNGSTVLPELRKGWSGETLGFSYSDPAKRLDVQAHSYRLCLLAGIQPGRAGALLDDSDGGTPQRFVWLSAVDRDAPDVAPEEPRPWVWVWQESGPFKGDHHGLVVMDVCHEARQHIDTQRLARLRGDGDALAGHDDLARLKVAAALGILDGRCEVSADDWELSRVVAQESARTRQYVQEALKQAAQDAGNRRAVAAGIHAEVAEETKEERAEERVYRLVKRHLPTGLGDSVNPSVIHRKLPGRDRSRFQDAWDRLVNEGQVQEIESDYWVRTRRD